MKKRIILAVLIAAALMAAPALFADTQVDIGVNVPYLIGGVQYNGQSVSEQIPFTIPIPDIMVNYFIGPEFLKVGVGVRIWTLILITGGYPIISVESELGPVVLNANIGGGVFGYTSIGASDVVTGQVFIPEVSAAYRLADWFSLGLGVIGVYLPEVAGDSIGYVATVFGRFRVN